MQVNSLHADVEKLQRVVDWHTTDIGSVKVVTASMSSEVNHVLAASEASVSEASKLNADMRAALADLKHVQLATNTMQSDITELKSTSHAVVSEVMELSMAGPAVQGVRHTT